MSKSDERLFLAEVARMARPTLGRMVAHSRLPAASLAAILRRLERAGAIEADAAQLDAFISALEGGGSSPAQSVTLHKLSAEILRAPIDVTASGLWTLRRN